MLKAGSRETSSGRVSLCQSTDCVCFCFNRILFDPKGFISVHPIRHPPESPEIRCGDHPVTRRTHGAPAPFEGSSTHTLPHTFWPAFIPPSDGGRFRRRTPPPDGPPTLSPLCLPTRGSRGTSPMCSPARTTSGTPGGPPMAPPPLARSGFCCGSPGSADLALRSAMGCVVHPGGGGWIWSGGVSVTQWVPHSTVLPPSLPVNDIDSQITHFPK